MGKYTELEQGYYWVRFRGAFHSQWVIALYCKHYYSRSQIDFILQDKNHEEYRNCCEWSIGDWRYPYTYVIEIDSRKIERNKK